MKTLLIGNGLEILFNQDVALNQIKEKGLLALNQLSNGKLEKFLRTFFEQDVLFKEKEEILFKNYPLIFQKLIVPTLIQKTNHRSVDQHLDEISWKIKPFLTENKIGLNANVLEVFIKHLFLFYLDQQWIITAKKLQKFLRVQEFKNYFNQFDLILTTNYTPILELINSQLDFPLPKERLVNLYGKFEPNDFDSYNDVCLLWQGKRKDLSEFWKPLKNFEMSQLEIVGFNFYDDKTLLQKLLMMLKAHEGSPNQINYLGYEKNDLDQFYQLLIDNQLQPETELTEYTTFKQKEQSGEIVVLKNQKENIEGYGYLINHDRYTAMNNLTLTRKSALIIETEFYYNLSKYFDDGYTIENKQLLVEISNQYNKGDDLVINFWDFTDNFCGAYNQTFKEYFKLVPELKIDQLDSEKPLSIEQVQLLEKGPLVISHEVVYLKKPNLLINFWNRLFPKKQQSKPNKVKVFFAKLFKSRNMSK